MTLDEFLDELKATPGPWRIRAGEIRCARGACPINAVMHRRDSRHSTLNSFTEAAELLELDLDTAIAIARAADFDDSTNLEVREVRARLLAGLGLAESAK